MASLDLDNAKALVMMQPNPVPGDDMLRYRFDRDFLVLKIAAGKIQGTGTFDFELRFDANPSNQGAGTLLKSSTGITITTGWDIFLPPSFDSGDPTIIPAGDTLWLELPVVSTGLARPVAAQLQVYGVELGT